MTRKVDIKAEPLLMAWTLLFCAFIGLSFLHERSAAPTARTEHTAPAEETALVELNTADAETLQTLPGIGEVLAQRIIDYRTENGPFETIEEVMEVQGIGQGKFEELKYYITANGKGIT